jgi:peptidoglycan/LPS O-acetylase OafA/YrhL
MRLHSLTGLRAVGAGLVFFNHFGDLFHDHFSWFVNRSLTSGRCGVSFFFILSGFVLTWSARSRDTPGSFYWRRFARIFPAHAVAWGLAVAILTWQGVHALDLRSLGSLLQLQAWFPDPAWHFAGNAVAWSLSCEAFFYLLFPALIPSVERLGRHGRRRVALGLLALAFAVPTVTQLLWGPVSSSTWLPYVFPGVRFIEFALGIVVATALLRGELPRIPVRAAYVSGALGLVAMQWLPVSWVPVASMIVPFTLILVARAQADRAGEASIFSGRVWVRLGEWSFAFYLLHELVLRVLGALVDVDALDALGIASVTGLALGGALAGSAALYTFIERPAERRLRDWRSARHPAVPI